ncbi:MAG: hypothetical protein V1929_00230 [bacterium]
MTTRPTRQREKGAACKPGKDVLDLHLYHAGAPVLAMYQDGRVSFQGDLRAIIELLDRASAKLRERLK